jgi:uncharacterized membrane protein YccC
MDQVLNTTTAGLAGFTMAIVALLRKHWPKLDGPVVLVVVLVVASGLVALTTPLTDVQILVGKIVAVFMAAAGTNSLLGSLAAKAAPATLEGGELLVAKLDETARPGDAGNPAPPLPFPPPPPPAPPAAA